MGRKAVALLLSMAMLFTYVLPSAAEAMDITSDVQNETEIYTISTNGSYRISGLSTANSILVKSGVTAELTLDGVSITTTAARSPIKLEAGAKLTLLLEGENTITAGADRYAGIAVHATTAENAAALIIDGSGTLNVSSKKYAAAIGGNSSGATYDNAANMFGKIVINGGTVNATTTATTLATIGGGTGCTAGGSIEINGGVVNATAKNSGVVAIGGRGAAVTINGGRITAESIVDAIGANGSTNSKTATVTINGGYVSAQTTGTSSYGISANTTVNGGSVHATVRNAPEGMACVTLQLPTGMENKELSYAGNPAWKTYSDSEGKLYIYLANGTTNFTIGYTDESGAEKSYSASGIDTGSSEKPVYLLKEVGDSSCTCGDDETGTVGLFLPEDITDTILVSQSDSPKQITLGYPRFVKSEACPETAHEVLSTVYQIESDSAGVASVIGNRLSVGYPPDGSATFVLKATATVNGSEYTAQKEIAVRGDNRCRISLENNSNIEITADGTDTMQIQVGGSVYASNVPVAQPVYIEQEGTEPVDAFIHVNGTAPVLHLANVNISRVFGDVLYIGNGAAVTLELEGENRFYTEADNYASIHGNAKNSELRITGSGSLETVSTGQYAGISSLKQLTVDSGTLIARGGSGGQNGGGAGIGGDAIGDAFAVVVNGGSVYAYGAQNAAGIGGSGLPNQSYQGGSVTINGGYVYAEGADGAADIGAGSSGGTDAGGEIVINGGSVQASLGSEPKNNSAEAVYLLKLQLDGVTGRQPVTYSVTSGKGDTENKIATATDETGALYLYLHNQTLNKYWIRVYDETGTIYYYYTLVNNHHHNLGTAVTQPTDKEITAFSIAGQLEEAVINSETHTIAAKIPDNIDINAIVPISECTGAEGYPCTVSGERNGTLLPEKNENDTYTAYYAALGHDLETQVYTVILTCESVIQKDEQGRLILDVSRYNIVIQPDCIILDGTKYSANEAGYVVCGTTEENTLSVIGAAGADIAPIVLDQVSITCPGTALTVTDANASISVNGNCTLSSSSDSAVRIQSLGLPSALTVTSADAAKQYLRIVSGSEAAAVHIGGNQMTITDVSYSIEGTLSIDGNVGGKFYTDDSAYAWIEGDMAPGFRPLKKQAGGDVQLYQVSAAIRAEEGGEEGKHVCTYRGKEYYVDDTKSLYLMVPDGAYHIEVSYQGITYQGDVTVAGSDKPLELLTVHIDSITPVNPADAVLLYRGGTVTFVVEGTLIAGAVKLAYLANDETGYVASDFAYVNEDGKYAIDLEFPFNVNPSPINYPVYYSKDGGKTFEKSALTVRVRANDSLNTIREFTINGQARSEFASSGDNNIINVYMPFDHVLTNRYYANIRYDGASISPAAGWANYSDGAGFKTTVYTVVSQSGQERSSYHVRVRAESVPVFQRAVFTNPATSAGGDVDITLSGSLLEYISHAEIAENQTVWVYLDDDAAHAVQAVAQTQDGVVTYLARVTAPENTDGINSAAHTITATIGSPQNSYSSKRFNNAITVPRKVNELDTVSVFEFAHQVSHTITDSDDGGEHTGEIQVVMPYDADLSRLLVERVALSDAFYASYALYAADGRKYEPTDEMDVSEFITCVVTAEDGTKRTYTITAQKQESPQVTSVVIDQPANYNPISVAVKVYGDYLDHIQYADGAVITVSAALVGGQSTFYADADEPLEDGGFAANIRVPANTDNINAAEYLVTVSIDGVEGIFTSDTRLVVPRKEYASDSIVEFQLGIAQETPAVIVDSDNNTGTVQITVPYNTNLSGISPAVLALSPNASISPAQSAPQNFNRTVTYTVTAEDGSTRTYLVMVERSGLVGFEGMQIAKTPAYYSDVEDIGVSVAGNFVPVSVDPNGPLDTLEIYAKLGDSIRRGTVSFPEAGVAHGSLTLDANDTNEDQEYQIYASINGQESLGGVLTVPARTTRKIASCTLGGYQGVITEEISGGTIEITLPYDEDIRALRPEITLENAALGDVCTMVSEGFVLTGTRARYAAEYQVSNVNDPVVRSYTVYATRSGQPTVSKMEITQPETFHGGDATLEIEGVFFDAVKVVATAPDGISIEKTVAPSQNGKATVEFHDVPINRDTSGSKAYRVVLIVDGFNGDSNEITFTTDANRAIVVPICPNCEILEYSVGNAVGVIDNDNKTVHLTLPYETDLRSIEPTVRVDGHGYEQLGAFALTEDRAVYAAQYDVLLDGVAVKTYTVYITRSGQPTVRTVTFTQPAHFADGNLTVAFDGIFFDDAKVSAVAADGSVVSGTVTFQEGNAVAELPIPVNTDVTAAAEYELVFEIDGFDTEDITFAQAVDKIIVPRRKTQDLKVNLPEDLQEGESRYDGTDITIDVPYCYAEKLAAVTPLLVYDADTVSPAEGTALDFSNLESPLTFTLSSAGEAESKTYTVHINLIGEDPYITSFTVENQVNDTEYNENEIQLKMPPRTNMTSLTPVVTFGPEDSTYSPQGAVDFSSSARTPVTFTVTNKYGVTREYLVSIIKLEEKTSGSGKKYNQIVMDAIDTASQQPALVAPYINGYRLDGTMEFRPENAITRAEIAKILSVLDGGYQSDTAYMSRFADANANGWCGNYMNFAVERGYLTGYEDGLLRPENRITRAEFAVVMARFLKLNVAGGKSRFADIDGYDWCRGQINALYDKGIITGDGGGRFRPGSSLTRAEAVTMVNRATGRAMTEDTRKTLRCPFSDISESHWAYDDVLAAACAIPEK